MKQKTILLILIFCWTTSYADFSFYQGVRQMGMGGASIAVVNDETALLSNPNGLGRLRDSFFTVFDPELSSNIKGYETLIGTGVYKSIDPSAVFDQLGDNQNRPYFFKGQTFPSIVLPNFGLGLLGRYEVVAERNSDGTYDYQFQNDYSLNVGFNLSFWGGRVKWGVAGRLINRTEYFGLLDSNTQSLEKNTFAVEGMGLGVDMGLTLTAPWKFLPTLSVLIRDVGHTSFTMGPGFGGNNSNGIPQQVEQSVDVAIALFPIVSNYTRATWTAEYTAVDRPLSSSEEVMDRLHLGAEINFLDAYFVRAGYHQQDWTAGLEYAMGVIQWQLASYAETIYLTNETKKDRRGIIKFAVRF